MKLDKYFIFLYQRNNFIMLIQKIKYLSHLQQFNQVIIIVEENMIVIRDSKTFYFNFDWPKDVHENLKHDIEFIIKSNYSFVEN